MWNLILQHQFWSAVIAYWIYSAAVSAMPDPMPNGNPGYLWMYRFLHTIAGNMTTAFGAKIPGIPNGAAKLLVLLCLLPFLLPTSGCGPRYLVHAGAYNQIDSAAYDALLIAEAAIDTARQQYAAGTLPAEAKPALNGLIGSYAVARQTWLTYRGILGSKGDATILQQQLVQDIADLSKAVLAFRQGGSQ